MALVLIELVTIFLMPKYGLTRTDFMNHWNLILVSFLINNFAGMSFAQRTSTLRRERGLIHQSLADATGIQVQQIKRNEAGTSQPSADALKKITQFFGLTTDWLLVEDSKRGPDDDLRLRFEAMGQLTPEEKGVARAVLEGLLLMHAAHRIAPTAPTA